MLTSVLGAAAAPTPDGPPLKGGSLSAAEIEARRQALREYFAKRRACLHVVATTRTDRGQIIDWVPRTSQYPGSKIASPPPSDNGAGYNTPPPSTPERSRCRSA